MHHQNQSIKQPTTFLKASDKRLSLSIFVVGLMVALPLANPMGGYPLLNHFFFFLTPLPLSLLILSLPLFVLWAISLHQETKFNEFLKEQHRRERTRLTGKVLFRAQLVPHNEGTSWEVVNTNQFDWTDAHAIIERVVGGKKACEKHYLGQVNQSQVVSIESKLASIDACKWRILVLTKEGCTTEFPDRAKPSGPDDADIIDPEMPVKDQAPSELKASVS